MASGSGHPQFEPVSPDEDERPANEGTWVRLMCVLDLVHSIDTNMVSV